MDSVSALTDYIHINFSSFSLRSISSMLISRRLCLSRLCSIHYFVFPLNSETTSVTFPPVHFVLQPIFHISFLTQVLFIPSPYTPFEFHSTLGYVITSMPFHARLNTMQACPSSFKRHWRCLVHTLNCDSIVTSNSSHCISCLNSFRTKNTSWILCLYELTQTLLETLFQVRRNY